MMHDGARVKLEGSKQNLDGDGWAFLRICQFDNLLVFDATTASATVVMIAISLSIYEQGGNCCNCNAFRSTRSVYAAADLGYHSE